MFRKSITAVLVFFGILALISAQEPSQSGEHAEHPCFFLTTQEKLLEGTPEERGDSWLIRLPGQTGGILVSKLDVLFAGPTRESVFEYRKNQLPPKDVGAASALAEWGTRNQLTEPALALLRKMAVEADPETRTVLQRQIDRIEYVERLKKDAEERLAKTASTKTPAEKDPELLRLEEFGRQVPLSIQDTYARKIQPLLLRRCAVSDCHQNGTPSMAFTLSKPDRRTPLRRNNLRNLEQVLRRVDTASPAASPILNHPEIVDQLGQQVYPFGADANSLKDYRTFSNWISSLGSKLKPISFTEPAPAREVQPKEEEGNGETPNAETPDTEPAFEPATAPAGGRVVDLTAGDPSPAPRYRKRTASEAFSSVIGKKAGESIPDEFDPGPFNEKYHPDRSADSELNEDH